MQPRSCLLRTDKTVITFSVKGLSALLINYNVAIFYDVLSQSFQAAAMDAVAEALPLTCGKKEQAIAAKENAAPKSQEAAS